MSTMIWMSVIWIISFTEKIEQLESVYSNTIPNPALFCVGNIWERRAEISICHKNVQIQVVIIYFSPWSLAFENWFFSESFHTWLDIFASISGGFKQRTCWNRKLLTGNSEKIKFLLLACSFKSWNRRAVFDESILRTASAYIGVSHLVQRHNLFTYCTT